MATPFQDFVNVELPRRVYTLEPSNSWTAGKVLLTTGQGLGVQALDYSGGAVSGEWDMTPTPGTGPMIDDTVNTTVSGTGPWSLIATAPGLCVATSTETSALGDIPAQFNNYANPTTFDPYLTYFGFMNAEMSAQDLKDTFDGNAPVTAKLILSGSIGTSTDNTYQSIKMSLVSGNTFDTVTDGQVHSLGQTVYYYLDQSGLSIRLMAKVASDSMFRLVCEGLVSEVPAGMKPFLIAAYQVLTPSQPITNFSLGGTLPSTVAPADPEGKRFLVSVGGTFNGETAEAGDIAEFLTPTDIFVTRDVNVLVSSFPTLQYFIDTQAAITGIEERTTIAEEDIVVLQGQVGDVFKDGRLPVENLVGATGTPFEYFLGNTDITTAQPDQKEYKVFTWENGVDETDYRVDFFETPDSGRHCFFFKLVLPSSNHNLQPLTRRVLIRSAYLDVTNVYVQTYENIAIDACQLKEVHGVYEAGLIRFLGYVSTISPDVFVSDRNPAYVRAESVTSLLDNPTGWYPGSSCVEKLIVIGNGTLAVILHYKDVGTWRTLPHLLESTLHLSLYGNTTGLTSVSMDGISIPDVPPSETHFYTYSPRLGCLTRTVS